MSIPERPRLRNVEASATTDGAGRRILAVTDPLALADSQTIGIPIEIAPYLGAADGTRNLTEIISLSVLSGAPTISIENLTQILEALDDRYLIENGRFKSEIARRLNEFRSKPKREPAHAWQVYPGESRQLISLLDGFYASLTDSDVDNGASLEDSRRTQLKAMVTPHIDYARGGQSYAATWKRASRHLQDIEVVVIFGTDHRAARHGLTLTKQSYASPLGKVNNDRGMVDDLADALTSSDDGIDPFREEYHHVHEHSIELCLVWLQHALKRNGNRNRALTVIPILCGALAREIQNGETSESEESGESRSVESSGLARAVAVLRELARRKRTLFVAAADLAHVGPAFGDQFNSDETVRYQVAARDRELMEHVVDGDREAFIGAIARHNDADRICGSSPIYMTLWCAEGETTGEWLAYQQCAADSRDASFVSIAGALLYGGI